MIHDDKTTRRKPMPEEKWKERMNEKKGINRDKQQTNICVLHDSTYKFEP